MKFHVRLALLVVFIGQLKLLSIIWTRADVGSSLAKEKQHASIDVEEVKFVLNYFRTSNFTRNFFFTNQFTTLPDYVRHSAICIPQKGSKNKCDIFLFPHNYPINRGSYGALFIGRKLNLRDPNSGEKIVIKFQNTLHKKRDRNDWIKNYANHLRNEIAYLKRFGYLRFVAEKQDDDFVHEFQASSLVLVFDFIEGHHMYYLIDNGLIESMDHFERIKSMVFDELNKFHKKGFCHGDLHGQNFLLELPKRPEDGIKVTLIDFGWTHEIKKNNDECITEDITRLEKAFDRVRRCLEKNLLRRFIKPCIFSPF